MNASGNPSRGRGSSSRWNAMRTRCWSSGQNPVRTVAFDSRVSSLKIHPVRSRKLRACRAKKPDRCGAHCLSALDARTEPSRLRRTRSVLLLCRHPGRELPSYAFVHRAYVHVVHTHVRRLMWSWSWEKRRGDAALCERGCGRQPVGTSARIWHVRLRHTCTVISHFEVIFTRNFQSYLTRSLPASHVHDTTRTRHFSSYILIQTNQVYFTQLRVGKTLAVNQISDEIYERIRKFRLKLSEFCSSQPEILLTWTGFW